MSIGGDLSFKKAFHLLFFPAEIAGQALIKKVTKKSSPRSAGKMKSVTTPVQGLAFVGLTDLGSFT